MTVFDRFEMFQAIPGVGQWYWRFKARNNEIVAQSEGYTTKWNCRKAVWIIKLRSLFARVIEVGVRP